MWKIFELIGRYFMLMGKVFSRPEKAAIYRRRIIYEMESLGIDSIGLTAIISVFIGAVITLQMCINLDSPFIPRSLVGYATRETMILEFSSTVVALILAGKVGSSIASEIGTMRITEQIDALEIMGVNSASYLILPKIVAAVVFFPFLTILSIAIGIIGGWAIAYLTGIMIPADYVDGLLMDFKPYSIVYSLIKTGSLVGYATRETMILEFSSTVVALILAGKVGSSIASEIGTMRITEQIDALEIMGVNSASYLILPKIVAAVVFFPFLTILSIAIGIIGGWAIAYLTGIMIPADYVDGLLMDFKPYSIVYSLIKTAVFAYIITSISAFYGYFAKGNSLEVGAASTRAVVASSVVIMIFNLILTQVLLI